MGAHPDAYKRLRGMLRRACAARACAPPDGKAALSLHIDRLLDEWGDYMLRATEWDAQYWGFDDGTWMVQERKNMVKQERMKKGFDGRWYAVH